MARYKDSSCRLCRREGLKLFIKGDRCYTEKCSFERRGYAPGDHGQSHKKQHSDYGVQLSRGFRALKLWLVLPIVATLAGLYAAWGCYRVWTGRLLGGAWARLRYSLAAACALFMCWFYAYWNILGFQYLT